VSGSAHDTACQGGLLDCISLYEQTLTPGDQVFTSDRVGVIRQSWMGLAKEISVDWLWSSARRQMKLLSICALLNYCDALARAYVFSKNAK
jgi:hypothetical protein